MILAVYGTLRMGEINYWSYIKPTGRFLGAQRLDGWQMYSNGSYPLIVPGDGSVVIEVYDVHPTDGFDVGGMEVRSGYDVTSVPTKWGNAYLFYYPELPEYKLQQVISGDWVNHQKEFENVQPSGVTQKS